MKAEVVLKLVSGALQDLEPDVHPRWAWEVDDRKVGLLDFLNAAIRSVVLQRPDVMAVTEVIRLGPGMRQSLPCPNRHGCRHKATMMIDVARNMGQCGDCPGPAIISVNTDVLMAWACSCAESPVVENWAYDRIANPRSYLVYPAVPYSTDVYVEATFARAPCEIAEPEQDICLPDDYAPALEHHMLASILSGDNDASNAQKAMYHMQMYNSLLGIKTMVDVAWPKAKNTAVPGGVS